MFKIHNTLGFCLTLAVLFAGTADTRAQIVIDDFEEGWDHIAPIPGNPPQRQVEIEVPSALGGYRSLEQVSGDTLIEVDDDGLAGILFFGGGGTLDAGTSKAEWDGEGESGLGGIDLTLGGDFFELTGVLIESDVNFDELNNLNLRVTDTDGNQSSFSRDWSEVRLGLVLTGDFGKYLIPFSSLTGGANFASVDGIELEFATTPASTGSFRVDSFSVVPEPSTALLFGPALLGLIGIARRKRAT